SSAWLHSLPARARRFTSGVTPKGLITPISVQPALHARSRRYRWARSPLEGHLSHPAEAPHRGTTLSPALAQAHQSPCPRPAILQPAAPARRAAQQAVAEVAAVPPVDRLRP